MIERDLIENRSISGEESMLNSFEAFALKGVKKWRGSWKEMWNKGHSLNSYYNLLSPGQFIIFLLFSKSASHSFNSDEIPLIP